MQTLDDSSETDEFGACTARFERWLRSAGVSVSENIRLADLRNQSAGRAVVATKDIANDSELFSIPRSAVLTPQTSALAADVQQSVDDPWLSLILAMIYEHHRGEGSKWKSYFDVLPDEFDTLMYWADHELEYLEGSAVVSKIGRQRADKTFKEQIVPTIQQHGEHFVGLDMTADNILALCHRMGSIIMAYAFDLERTSDSHAEQDGWEEDSDEGGAILPKGMVPLADMLNADADRNNAKLFYEDEKVVMKTIKDITAGQELFNDYGPLPSADVLRRYGYVTQNYVKYDVVEISLHMIKEVAQQQLEMQYDTMTARTEYLDDQGALDDGYDVTRLSSEEGQFPDVLRILLNALTMPQADFDKMCEKDKLPKPELSKESLELLYAILVRRRSLYPAQVKVAENAASLEYKGRSRQRREMACHVIRGEKGVLQEAADTLHALMGEGRKRKADAFEEEADVLRAPTKEAKSG